jgi:hypothetical protein
MNAPDPKAVPGGPGRLGAGPLLAAALLFAAAAAARADIKPLTLWDRTYRAELVARVSVLDGDDRLAKMAVLEVIKGDYDREVLKIVFRAHNLAREPWEERIVFEKGQELILFLNRFTQDGVPQEPDEFTLVRGFQGKVDVPPEGADAFLAAVRRFAAIQKERSQLLIWEAAKGLLREDNPYLVEAGFEQVLKFRLADEALVPVLLQHLDGPSVPFREQSARCLGQVFEETRRADDVLETEDHVRDLLVHTAMSDQSPSVRVEAIRALEAKWDAALVPSFRRIAGSDPSQAVRYEAERAIYRIENGAPDRPPSN